VIRHAHVLAQNTSSPGKHLRIKRKTGSTQRTATAITRFEPFEQTRAVELVPTSPASAVGETPIWRDREDTVANGALRDAVEMQRYVLAEHAQCVNDGPGLEIEYSLRG